MLGVRGATRKNLVNKIAEQAETASALVEEERAVAKPGWQRGRGSERCGIVLND